MSGSVVVADRIVSVLERVLGAPVKLRVRAWDGSAAGPADAPTLVISSRRAIRRLLWQPNELGLGRAYVAGELDVEGDLYEALAAVTPLIDPGSRSKPTLSPVDRGELIKTAVVLGAVGPQPQPPPEEASLHGRRHSRSRDRAAIRHHYDAGNDFYRIVLGPSLVYSCAYWNTPDATLETAQAAKLELICKKLGLRSGMRLLDVGCGWGSMGIHAAREFGVNVVGVTLSGEQVELARKRAGEAGVASPGDIGLQAFQGVADWPRAALARLGSGDHVGPDR